MPEDRHDDVISAGVFEALQVVEDRVGAVVAELDVSRLILLADLRDDDLLSKAVFNGIYGSAELEEHPERREVRPKRHRRDVVSTSPGPVPVAVATGELVQVLDLVLLAELDEGVQSILVVL